MNFKLNFMMKIFRDSMIAGFMILTAAFYIYTTISLKNVNKLLEQLIEVDTPEFVNVIPDKFI